MFVTTGEHRGDQVAILKGIKEGDTVSSPLARSSCSNGSPCGHQQRHRSPAMSPTLSPKTSKAVNSGMKFTDIFIRRPVLAMVLSLLILVLGLRSFGLVCPYPPVSRAPQNAVITVSPRPTYGADPDLVAGFITTPLENAIAQVNGIDYMTSSSTNSNSTITVYLKLNYDSNKALTEMNAQISSGAQPAAATNRRSR